MEWYLAAGDVASVPRLRSEVVAHLARHATPGSDLEDARLVVSELVTNAVQHSGGPVRVAVCWDSRHPKVTVSDLGPGFSHPIGAASRTSAAQICTPPDPAAERGRGLFLVSVLARELDIVTGHDGGSAVSATLEVDRAATQPPRR